MLRSDLCVAEMTGINVSMQTEMAVMNVVIAIGTLISYVDLIIVEKQ